MIGRRGLLAVGTAGLTLGVARAVRAAASPKARFFMIVSGPAGGPVAEGERSGLSGETNIAV
jgi:hypothetical protein